jgi:acylphosphatase
VFKAIKDSPGCKDCGMPARDVGPFDCPVCGERTIAIRPSSFWGSRFTVQALEAIKKKIGHWAWSTEYDQTPHDDSTSWFHKDWIEKAWREDLAPLTKSARRILPWKAISVTLSGDEAVKIASMGDRKYAHAPGDLGPYQAIVQAWDPAWARKKGGDQMTAWMAGVGMGLTWDDRFDIFWLDRDKALPGTGAYREWMYRSWTEDIAPFGEHDRTGQLAMIVEENGAGVLFQYGVEETWGSVPLVTHVTGSEKHDLEEGIPGLASSYKDGRVVIRANGSERQRKTAEELKYELQHSGRSQFTDVLMATWFAWSYLNRWMRDVRDPARYEELVRRNALKARERARASSQTR